VAEGDSLYGSSKRLKIMVSSKLLFVSKEATAALSEHSSHSLLAYSIKNMLPCKAKYFD